VATTAQEVAASRLEALEGAGISPYPHFFAPTITASAIRIAFDHLISDDRFAGAERVVGRVMALRRHGKVTFLDLVDRTGQIQVALRPDELGIESASVSTRLIVGDVIGVGGSVFRTRTGELTVGAKTVMLLAPCLQLMPDKQHGLQDSGLMRTQRHLDLMIHPESRERFLTRSHLIQLLRQEMWARGFVEVETAVLDSVYGGAEARPFTSWCMATNREVFLRISPELALKRLLIGGMERVFEIGKQFRNERIDARHHPEFTSIEVYEAYADYYIMMELTETLLSHAAMTLCGTTQIICRMTGEPILVDLSSPFRRITMLDAIAEQTGLDFRHSNDCIARSQAAELGVIVSETATADEVVIAVFEERVEATLIQPTFVLDYPSSLCPLTKQHRVDPRLAERFELYIGGFEFANAYSELNDPREQARQFATQAARREAGDKEAHMPDWEYVAALTYGMPPAGGLGIGIDRLALLFTGASHVQDVILFPLRR